jgi:hypothetical protein
MPSLKCLACLAAEAGSQATVRNPSTLGELAAAAYLNALAQTQVFTLDRVRGSLCASHADHLRQFRNLSEGQARHLLTD